jgi:predicted  nucleic acid-binding Zn-ribbon protein
VSEPLLQQILNELQTMNHKMGSLESQVLTIGSQVSTMDVKISAVESRISTMESKISTMESRISIMESTMATKDDVKELPYMRQALIEINDRTKHIESTQRIHSEAIINHDHQFNTINKRIFTLESDVDRLKNR